LNWENPIAHGMPLMLLR